MLINDPAATADTPFSALFGAPPARHLQTGVYLINHFGSTAYLPDYYPYPKTTVNCYGVCDNLAQLLAACPELEAPGRKFVVALHEINRSDQPEDGGWRWRKWKPYIGTQCPTTEYIHDEPLIETVYCYHIYELQ